ncbi:MAG: DUF5431 family protein [Klebsiella huaxiensis]|uniref:DUF5431 family protein n=1 Tax=Klebsiella TaxID=570 RepID=UPI001E613141|nr:MULTISPECIES: DUF5431 family protein [Klebsiella]WEJ92471.1 MAG: DUF5431 family protein [Klebsiella huaxiensis]
MNLRGHPDARQHQTSLLPVERQGEGSHENAAKFADMVCINRLYNAFSVYLAHSTNLV